MSFPKFHGITRAATLARSKKLADAMPPKDILGASVIGNGPAGAVPNIPGEMKMKKPMSGTTDPNTGIHGPADSATQNKTTPGNVTMGNKSADEHYGPGAAGGAGSGPETPVGANATKKGRPKGARFTSIQALRDYSKKMGA